MSNRILFLIALTCAVIDVLLYADASTTPPDSNQAKRETPEQVRKNEFVISQITNCRILAMNSGMMEEAKRLTVKLSKFDEFYYEYKIFYTGRALGFLGGIIYQMGYPNPTPGQVKKVAMGLFFKQCEVMF